MSSPIASIIVALVVVALYWLDRDGARKPSVALWIPVGWLSISMSRPLSLWLNVAPVRTTDQYLEGNPFDRIVFAGFTGIGLVIIAGRWPRIRRILLGNKTLVLCFVYCGLSMVWSDYPYVTVKRWVKAVGDLVMVLIVLSDREPVTAIRRFLARPAYVLIPLSILLIKWYPTLGRIYGRHLGDVRYTGVALDKNGLGLLCMICGLAAVWRLLSISRQSENRRWGGPVLAQYSLLIMIAWLFWKCNSMTSLLCFFVGCGLLFMSKAGGAGGRFVLVHVLTAASVCGCFAVLFSGVAPGFFEAVGRDATLTGRTEMWRLLMTLTPSATLGAGYETFWLGPRLETIWRVYWWAPNQAHNGYLEVFLNLGWIGVALLAIFLVMGYQSVTTACRKAEAASGLRFAYYVIGLLYNITEAAFFRMLAPVWILMLLAGTRCPTSWVERPRAALAGSDVGRGVLPVLKVADGAAQR